MTGREGERSFLRFQKDDFLAKVFGGSSVLSFSFPFAFVLVSEAAKPKSDTPRVRLPMSSSGDVKIEDDPNLWELFERLTVKDASAEIDSVGDIDMKATVLTSFLGKVDEVGT